MEAYYYVTFRISRLYVNIVPNIAKVVPLLKWIMSHADRANSDLHSILLIRFTMTSQNFKHWIFSWKTAKARQHKSLFSFISIDTWEATAMTQNKYTAGITTLLKSPGTVDSLKKLSICKRVRQVDKQGQRCAHYKQEGWQWEYILEIFYVVQNDGVFLKETWLDHFQVIR